jgi:hypothetical protein
MQRAEALRRDFHPRNGLGQATDVSDDRKVEAMGRLDAMLGRSLLDAPDVGEDEAPAPDLWRDDEPAASPDRPRTHKGSSTKIQGNKRPDLNSDRAEEGEFGTAYRIPGETSHVSQPRLPSTTKRHMRRMRQDR